ncbi:uncharacterized protein FOMMEDRAFT_104082 [Fomitiporia mediterranea MF3/22]|uniref:uncharacterized protein n=1 Tax=Fomitiporia mediterranea (strain MF3/22) TaxID=694068 RepID=UPI0004407E4C|nr:uncharacterized protein FOMMEDRAFT_104082 [Fomitiporia mediterranea MF3/22]EJD05817.1 hypothetical protein FOMMEDRAFT_104082 [Fomitiporia mediterranea MF3/22]
MAYYFNNLFDSNESSRYQSPRAETPEPFVRQGRRNAPVGVQLLDDEGAVSEKFERCLKHIFAKYCTPKATPPSASKSLDAQLLVPPENAYFTPEALDQWAIDTNGSPLPNEAKEELELLDGTEEGYLTFQGFLQIYQLQTESDEEETWKDLFSHGFDRNLKLVTTRREDMEVELSSDERTSRESTPTRTPMP